MTKEQRPYEEAQKLPAWFLHLILFTNETGMSRLDVARMRDSWVNERLGTIHRQGRTQEDEHRADMPIDRPRARDTCRTTWSEKRPRSNQ